MVKLSEPFKPALRTHPSAFRRNKGSDIRHPAPAVRPHGNTGLAPEIIAEMHRIDLRAGFQSGFYDLQIEVEAQHLEAEPSYFLAIRLLNQHKRIRRDNTGELLKGFAS